MDIIIRTICEHFGKDVCESLLDFHAVTGKDMTSYFFRTGKVKASKKLLSNPTKMNLIKELGKAEIFSAKYIKSAEKFIRSVVYAGEHLENFVDTKTRIYKNLKRKLSMVVPPESD